MATGASNRVVNVINLGRMGFLQAYSIQMRYAKQHMDELAGRGQGQNTLLLVEHTPVYTAGIRDQEYDQIEENRLKNLGARFYRTNRGGLITFHGPGQLVAYPILNLRLFQPSMRWYISTLEAAIINTCRRFGIEASRTSHTGVWVQDRKIGAIGVHGSRYITTHGLSLNCDTDLTWFRHIIPCGINGKAVTSVTKEVNAPTPINNVIRPFLSAFSEEFQCELDLSILDSGDADLIREDPNDPYHHHSHHEPEEGEDVGRGGRSGAAVPTTVKAAQQRWMSTSTLTTSKSRNSTRETLVSRCKPRVSMW